MSVPRNELGIRGSRVARGTRAIPGADRSLADTLLPVRRSAASDTATQPIDMRALLAETLDTSRVPGQ
ncbi:hypothetical protein LQK89_07295 [Curtobacterium sp. C1]|uniref:hypothetical protein n=1 Tax=Curtobacterium TaxID=2034 RepID=UPI001E47AD9E|nr:MULTISPECIES: hypothetical protein [Curtobacterium]MDK8173635.1 hypothetical protein [Curtobacterium citreum]UFU15486.1 hypothetical protein LQK89_07295 [Curtobacterium sp. C1]